VNNRRLEEAFLGYAAKYQKRYGAKLYGLSIEGDHIHLPALFPLANRAYFMRDFNSSVARSLPRYVSNYVGGRLWARRYSSEFICDDESLENQFFYTVLQPIQDGLVPTIREYPGYNCFHDAVYGIKRKFKVVNWEAYNSRRRWDPDVSIVTFTEEFELEYARLPGYEELTQREYAKLMHKKLEERRIQIVEERRSKGLGFVGREALLQVIPGTRARRPKESTRFSHRPRIFSATLEQWKTFTKWYFELYDSFKAASYEYRNGNAEVKFPPGSYKPPLFTVLYTVSLADILH
jgi:hypothetical protein